MPERFQRILWCLWLAAAVAMTAPVMAWHIGYFRSPGRAFYIAAQVGLPLLGAIAVLWSRLRGARWRRYEPLLIAGPAFLLAAVRAPVAAGAALLIFASAYAGGRRMLEAMDLRPKSPAARIALSCAAGFGVLHILLFGAGMAGVLYWWVVLPLLLLPLLFWRNVLDGAGDLLAGWGRLEDLSGPAAGMLVPFATLLSLCSAAVALTPSIAYDAVTMHLPLAQFYVQEHALVPRPGLEYSFFPQSAELVFAAAMMFGGQTAAQLITPGFFVLFALLLWAVLRECGASGPGAFCGTVFAASMPFLHWSGSVVKNDLQLGLFQLASLYSILLWRRSGSFRWIQAAAIFAGASFGVKHPALFAGLPLGLLLLWAVWRQPRRARALALVLLLAAGFGLMWHARTFALVGNPVYPLRAGESATPDHGVDKDLWAAAVRVAKLPLKLPFGGFFYFESPSPTPLGLALVLFLPAWLLTGRPGAAERICLFFGLLAFFIWGWLSPMVRYIGAPLAVLTGLAGMRAARVFDRWSGAPRWITGFAVLWCAAQALCSLAVVEINAPQLRYLAGALDRAEYLEAASFPYPSLAFVNRNTGPGDRILGIENCMTAYAPPAPRYDPVCGDTWTAETIARWLGRARYTWLVAPAGKSEETAEALRRTGRTGEERYRDRWFAVYRLH